MPPVPKTDHVVFFSGGAASYCAAKRVVARHGATRTRLLFTDTKSEDADLYRFVDQAAGALGAELVWARDGRDLWELFNEKNFIGNTRVDICSRVLKRDVARGWVVRNYPDPARCVLYFGFDSTEPGRFRGQRGKPGAAARWLPYRAEAPLLDEPGLSKCDMLREIERDGIDPPRMYDEGFPHNNCGGFCVKAGHAHFLHLLQVRPAKFMEHANEEQAFRDRTGADVAVLRDRRGGITRPLPMLEFKRQVESGELEVNRRDWGKGCQCFNPDED